MGRRRVVDHRGEFAGLTQRRRERGLPTGAIAPAYVVEKVDPYSVHPHLTDEEHNCPDAIAAAIHWEDLTGLDAIEAAVLLDAGETLRHVDEETGVEVTARPA